MSKKSKPAAAGTPTVVDNTHALPNSNRISFTRELGLAGYEHLEPVLLASLVTGQPLLLLGNHGTGKSLLLQRIAEALNLQWRHYNASLLNFDDLVGYPLPDSEGNLKFIQTPASVWGAQAVLFDEISRARPDIQNRLFPIIHEKKVQGLPLHDLVHRWAAINPPETEETTDHIYSGVQALDVALADRFAFHVEVPDWNRSGAELREDFLRVGRQGAAPGAAELLKDLLQQTRDELPAVRERILPIVTRYVGEVCELLATAGHRLSVRRGVLLVDNLVAAQAAGKVLAAKCGAANPVDSTTLAEHSWSNANALKTLLNSLPLKASGIYLQPSKPYVIHREAWGKAHSDLQDSFYSLSRIEDPVVRIRKTFELQTLQPEELITLVLDTITIAAPGARYALCHWISESQHLDRLPLLAAEQVLAHYKPLVAGLVISRSIYGRTPGEACWKGVIELQARLDPANPFSEKVANCVADAFDKDLLTKADRVEACAEDFLKTLNRLDNTRRSLNSLLKVEYRKQENPSDTEAAA